jgi:hypothetical protein
MRRHEVNKLFLAALMTWALCFSGTNCGAARVQSPQTREPKTESDPAAPTVTLTPEHPSNSFPVEANVLTSDPEILEVAVTKVVNPSRTAIDVSVYLTKAVKGKSEPEQTLIGNFSLYPADQPGTFMLNPAPAIEKLCGEKPAGDAEVRLVFDLKQLHETKLSTPLELTIAQPKWRAREK